MGLNQWVVPAGGLEPPQLALADFESESVPFSLILKLLQNLSKPLIIWLCERCVSFFFFFCSKNCSKKKLFSLNFDRITYYKKR
jgi:hypothetical protein